MLLGIYDPFICRIKYLEVVYLDYGLKIRHLRFGKPFPYDIIHKKDLGLGMINQMMYVCRLELMKKRHRNGTIGHCGQKCHRPVRLVS